MTDWLNIATRFGADTTGTADATAAIQSALTAAQVGGTVYLPVGTYRVSAPLTIPPGVELRGSHGRFPAADQPGTGGAVIAAAPQFQGPAIIQLLDAALGGYDTRSTDQVIGDLTLDGSAIKPAGSVDGIHAVGRVTGVYLHDLCLYNIPRDGLSPGYCDGRNPFSWRLHRVTAVGAGGTGLHVANFTDTTFLDCEAIACGGDGWYIDGNGGCTFSACRAEWNRGFGFHLISGPLPNAVFTGCSTDSNNRSGFRVDADSGYGSVLLSGCRFGRDGRNSGDGGGGYAGLDIDGAPVQVIIDGCVTSVGADDDGTGPYRPQYGISIQNAAYVQVRGGMWWGVTAGWFSGGGNRVIRRAGADVATGRDWVTLSAPTVAAGANSGEAAPLPVLSPASNDEHGTVSFGSGTGPGAGEQCRVAFATPFVTPPAVIIAAQNDATAVLAPYASVTESGFSVQTLGAPDGRQGNSVYRVSWIAQG